MFENAVEKKDEVTILREYMELEEIKYQWVQFR